MSICQAFFVEDLKNCQYVNISENHYFVKY